MTLTEKKKRINSLIEKSNSIYVMGHQHLDLDAIGSSIGICEYVKKFNKKATIIINDRTLEKGVKRLLSAFGDKYTIKKSREVKAKVKPNDLLIVVDTNKQYLLQDSTFLDMIDNILVIDHHDINKETIARGLVIVDEDASSTCEMIIDFLDSEQIDIDKDTATALLAGITLDTNNFVLKTNKNTFRAAFSLTERAADFDYVQYLLKQDLKKYIERQKVITNVKMIKNLAITKAKSNAVYRREDLARVANTLIMFNGVEASFVVGRLDNKAIGISARSLGKLNVGKILEYFGGGGDEYEAGARIADTSVRKIEIELLKILKNLK